MTSYFTLKGLTAPTEGDLATSFKRMAEVLGKARGESARIQFRILDGDEESHWSVVVGAKTSYTRAEKIKKPDFEIITSAETWWEIVRGSLAPLRAFVQGKMRVRGDIELGTRLLQRLSSGAP